MVNPKSQAPMGKRTSIYSCPVYDVNFSKKKPYSWEIDVMDTKKLPRARRGVWMAVERPTKHSWLRSLRSKYTENISVMFPERSGSFGDSRDLCNWLCDVIFASDAVVSNILRLSPLTRGRLLLFSVGGKVCLLVSLYTCGVSPRGSHCTPVVCPLGWVTCRQLD